MPRLSEGAKGKVGPASAGAWREAARKLNKAAVQVASGKGAIHESFLARIKSGPEAIGASTTRWTYQWEEVSIKTDWTYEAVSGGRRSRAKSGSAGEFTWALNLCEMCQGSSATMLGPGVTASTIPSGFSLQPIAEHTCVVMHTVRFKSGKTLYCFSMPNAIDGSCPAFTGGGGGQGEEPI